MHIYKYIYICMWVYTYTYTHIYIQVHILCKVFKGTRKWAQGICKSAKAAGIVWCFGVLALAAGRFDRNQATEKGAARHVLGHLLEQVPDSHSWNDRSRCILCNLTMIHVWRVWTGRILLDSSCVFKSPSPVCHRVVFPHARTDASFHLVRGPHLVSRRLGGRDDLLAECRDNSQLGNP